ncbi:hypothetical protein SAMN04488113_10564 [Alkalibacterium gilvum]|uniref:Uncharacterized protein n=1 Tax=Alkalibacterium gilvum TaxID=1130080 RepID=A0A1H6SAJ7_9LACT|nr:hypothetical protein SAMN04488113_10564 [Alkalibacterium gilvum]
MYTNSTFILFELDDIRTTSNYSTFILFELADVGTNLGFA